MAALAAKDNIKRLAKRRILILLVLAVLACFGGIISIMKGSVNVPLNEITKGMIDRTLFRESETKPIIINCARGPIINEDDLIRELEDKNISTACLDVFNKEPPLIDEKILGLENTILTPHIGYFTKEAMLKRASIVFSNLYSYLDGKLVNSVY